MRYTLLIALFLTTSAHALTTVDGVPLEEPSGAPLSLSVRTFGSGEGLPQLTVYALAQASDGWIYAGTQDGLARYDGRTFQSIFLEPGAHEKVTHLLADPRGGLWAGTDELGLFRLDADGPREIRAADGARMPAVEALATARDGASVWVGTPDGLWRCTDACTRVAGSEDLEVADLLEGDGPAGPCLWVGTNVAGLHRYDHAPDGAFVRAPDVLTRESGLTNNAVRGLLQFPSKDGAPGALWIAGGRGVAVLRGDTITQYADRDGFPIGSAFALVPVASADGTTDVLAALFGGGLVRFREDGRWRHLGLAEGVPDNYLYSLLVTGTGPDAQVWIGTASTGIARIEPGRWRTYDERHGLPQRGVVSVGALRDARGRDVPWAGTLGGSVVMDGAGWRPLLPPPFRDRVVYDVLTAPNGRTWVGTISGLLAIDGDRVVELTNENDRLPAVSADHLFWRGGTDGELWIGTGHGLAVIRDGATIEPLFPDDPVLGNLSFDDLLPLGDAADPDVTIAMATARGVWFTQDGTRLDALRADCLPHPEALDLERGTTEREFWVGTRRGAVRVRRTATGFDCALVAEPDGMPRLVYAMTRDLAGRVYLFGYDGVRRIASPDGPLDDPERMGYSRYGLEDGLPSLEFNRSAWTDADGRVWAANSGGLVVIDPAAGAQPAADAPLHLEASVAGVPLAAQAPLAHDHEEVAFDYRLLSYVQEHRIRYRTRLVGLDEETSMWSATARRRYNRLPAGDYEFRVEARDAAGRTHGPLAFAFRVGLPWWQHPATLAGLVLAAIGAGLAIGRWRGRAVARRARELETLVGERTRALEQASNTDPLTGALNRRSFYSRIGDWLAEGPDRLLLMLIDIDHFKQINDVHGHAAGDCVLVEVCSRLAGLTTRNGFLYRWGGEEFLLVVRRIDPAAADHIARAALDTVAARPIPCNGKAIEVRCSIGYTVVGARARPSDIDAVIARADKALYQAKQEGRDRAVGAIAENDIVEVHAIVR